MRYPLSFILLLLLQPANANPLLKGFTAEYSVSRNGTFLGISKRRLISRELGTKLDYASTTIPKGVVALFISDRFMEHSLIEAKQTSLHPIRYDYQRSGGKKEITFQARFDWQNKIIQMSNHNSAIAMPNNPHDLLSFQLALMAGLYKGQRHFNFHIVDHKRIRLQSLEYTLTVKMPSSSGELDVLKLDHQANNADYRFTFWCAKQLNYLPILIQKTRQNGDVTELKLKQLNNEIFKLPDQQAEDEEDF